MVWSIGGNATGDGEVVDGNVAFKVGDVGDYGGNVKRKSIGWCEILGWYGILKWYGSLISRTTSSTTTRSTTTSLTNSTSDRLHPSCSG